MTPTRRTFPESFKREAVEQVLAGTPLRHVAQALDITEALPGKWKRQCQLKGADAFPSNGKQLGEAAELKRLRDELARVTMERDVLKNCPPRRPVALMSRNSGDVHWVYARTVAACFLVA